MAAPQGIAYFSGIRALLSASFTLTHGIRPSVAVIRVPPQEGLLSGGSMVWQYGSVTLTWPDCRVDRVQVETDGQGRTVWALHILDRRWKWIFGGRISGYYNVRRGKDLIEETEKTPRELATLCLEAMGEERFDVDKLPEDPRPEIEWDYDLPAEALARLCDSLGYRVVLTAKNRVSIEKAGEGALLPVGGGDVLNYSAEVDPPERPDVLIFAAGRTRWQIDAELEAVGLDEDGEIRLLDELTYTPLVDGNRTWKYADLGFFNGIENQRLRELAKECVFRWYRIKPPLKLPREKDEITELDRVLPIETEQVEQMNEEGRRVNRPAWVYGKWWAGTARPVPETEEIYPDILDKPEGLYHRGFQIDQALGIVKFSEPVHQLEEMVYDGEGEYQSGGELLPAELKLRVAVSLRDEETRGWLRREVERKLPGKKTGAKPRYVVRDDIYYGIYQKHSKPKKGIHHNDEEVAKYAEHYLDAAEKEYQLEKPGSVTYGGFKALSPDGAIQQITWSIDGEGKATTRASRNKEEILIAETYEERRFVDRLREGLRREKTSRQRREDSEKGQP